MARATPDAVVPGVDVRDNASIETATWWAFGVAVVALAIVGGVSLSALDSYAAGATRARRVHALAAQCDRLIIDLLNIETGHRGYVITGIPAFLEPHATGLAAIDRTLEGLRALASDDSETAGRVAALEALVRQRTASSLAAVALRRDQGFGAARAGVVSGEGKRLMDRVRVAVSGIVTRERERLAGIDAERERHLRRTRLAVGTFGLGAAGILWALGGRIRAGTALRREARARIEALNGQLQRESQALATENAERRRAEELLRVRNAELGEFAYTVSHDLKAPLRGIQGYAQELLRRHAEGMSERARFCADRIVAAARNLDALIEDLLTYSRLEIEEPELSRVDVGALVQTLVRERDAEIEKSGAQVALDARVGGALVWERGVRQIFLNLLDNALKYSRGARPPRVTIAALETADGIRFVIEDNGIGFDMKYHDRIFGLFNRLVRETDFEGTGAGLAIAQKLAARMRGSIRAESAPGEGARFIVDLPFPSRDIGSRPAVA